jgi:hypothetical protein
MTREAVDKPFDSISPRYGDRNGGYLRIIHGGFRQGDGGDIAFVELLGSEATLDEKRTKRNEARASVRKRTARPWKRQRRKQCCRNCDARRRRKVRREVDRRRKLSRGSGASRVDALFFVYCECIF